MVLGLASERCRNCDGSHLDFVRFATVEDYAMAMGWGSGDFDWKVVAETLRELNVALFRCTRCFRVHLFMNDVGAAPKVTRSFHFVP